MSTIRSTEDYLETIYKLRKEKGQARLSNVAEELKISKPSVTQMVQKLAADGFIDHRPYAPIILTKKGEAIGRKIAQRHSVLEEFLTILGIPNYIRERDIHGIEHFLSDKTLKALKKAARFLKDKKFSNTRK